MFVWKLSKKQKKQMQKSEMKTQACLKLNFIFKVW